MIELGYYTIGRGMKNKQHKFKILGESEKGGIKLLVGDNLDGRLNTCIYRALYYRDDKINDFKMGSRTFHPPTQKTRYNMWEIKENKEVGRILGFCGRVLKLNYPSTRFIIYEEKLKELEVLNAI